MWLPETPIAVSPFTLRTGETSRGAIDWVELRPSKIVHGYLARALMYPEVPFSKINISLLRNFGRFFETKRFFFSPKNTFWLNVKTAVSP